MAEIRRESLLFYKYLCHKIGTQVKVRTRRLCFIICDIQNHPLKRNAFTFFPEISSESKAEGLNLNGSDVDIMLIDIRFEVYESESEAVHGRNVVLIMDTEDPPHCFSKLRLHTNYNRSKRLLSSELYKEHNLTLVRQAAPKFNSIHGPCISDYKERYDFATCLKCTKWISQAQPWIHRPRAAWPSADNIEKIIKCGVLFVPIGCKESSIKKFQWRISFSVSFHSTTPNFYAMHC
ncbi:unnamed protein product [Mytilus coruscus]|uniref:Uncharacterized protein n=1 Tax=Mytilus coruscus TaxID=42192 RepID=A0A6J8DYQ7_MYTCO|nr:unnamed protein product [Mytilus coruscus]